MKLLISRVAPNTRVKLDDQFTGHRFDRHEIFRLATRKPTEACWMDQVIPMTEKVSIRFGSAAFAQLPRVAEKNWGLLFLVVSGRTINYKRG